MDHLLFSNMLYYFSVGHVDPTALKSLGQGVTKELQDDHEETKRGTMSFKCPFVPLQPTATSYVICSRGNIDTRNQLESYENERR